MATVDLGKYILPRDYEPGLLFEEAKAKKLKEMLEPINWLLNTESSLKVKNRAENKRLSVIEHPDGSKALSGLPSFKTTPPVSSTGECCWNVMSMEACENELYLDMLCIKDCITDEDEAYNSVSSGISLSLADFMTKGKTTKQAIEDRLRENFLFRMIYQLWYGDSQNETPLSKPFHGVEDVMSSVGVRTMIGSNPIATAIALDCRAEAMGIGEWVAWVPDIGLKSIQRFVSVYENGGLANGWELLADGSLKYGRITFKKNVLMDYDKTNMTFDMFLMSTNAIGALSTVPLHEPKLTENLTNNTIPDSSGSCGGACYYAKGAAGVFSNNLYKLVKVIDMPADSACVSGVIDLDTVGDSLVPIPT